MEVRPTLIGGNYEVDDYRRVEVLLASGVAAWAYLAPETLTPGR